MNEKSSDRQRRRKLAIAAWLADIVQREGVGAPTLAKRWGVSPSTLYRALDENDRFAPSNTTIDKIEANSGYRLSEAGSTPSSVVEGDAERLAPAEIPGELTPASPQQTAWRLHTRAAELAGYLPGDLVLVDAAVAPMSGDLVCARVYDVLRGSASTVFRIFEPPFLTTRTLDPASHAKPVLHDGDRAAILGTVVRMLRQRVAPVVPRETE